MKRKKKVSKLKQLEIVNRSLVAEVASLEGSLQYYSRQNVAGAKFPARVFKLLWPESFGAPDGKWHPMDEQYSQHILKQIKALQEKAGVDVPDDHIVLKDDE